MTLEKYFASEDRKHKTQDDLAQSLGVSQSYISLLVARKKRPSLPLAKRIVEATGGEVTYDDLVALAATDATPASLDLTEAVEQVNG